MQNLQIDTEPGAGLETKLNFAAGGIPRNNEELVSRDLQFHVRGKMYQDIPNLDH